MRTVTQSRADHRANAERDVTRSQVAHPAQGDCERVRPHDAGRRHVHEPGHAERLRTPHDQHEQQRADRTGFGEQPFDVAVAGHPPIAAGEEERGDQRRNEKEETILRFMCACESVYASEAARSSSSRSATRGSASRPRADESAASVVPSRRAGSIELRPIADTTSGVGWNVRTSAPERRIRSTSFASRRACTGRVLGSSAPWASRVADIGDTITTMSNSDSGDEVGVGRGVHAAIDVAPTVVLDGAEESGDRRRRLHGDADGGVRTVVSEHDSVAVLEIDGADPQRAFRPVPVAVHQRDSVADDVGRRWCRSGASRPAPWSDGEPNATGVGARRDAGCARRVGVASRAGGPPVRPTIAAASSEIGSPMLRAARSSGGNPARNVAATAEPADVPTRRSASRASKPASASAVSTPAWYAAPAMPPAPSTTPTVGIAAFFHGRRRRHLRSGVGLTHSATGVQLYGGPTEHCSVNGLWCDP